MCVRVCLFSILVLCFLSFAKVANSSQSSNYISKETIDLGGGEVKSGKYILGYSVGEVVIGSTESANFSSNLGYYSEVIITPTAYIDSISPNPADQGQLVQFKGHGSDMDGAIVAYKWRSSIDGILSDTASFDTSTLSPGTHTIYFKVQDNTGTWSAEAKETLIIKEKPVPSPPLIKSTCDNFTTLEDIPLDTDLTSYADVDDTTGLVWSLDPGSVDTTLFTAKVINNHLIINPLPNQHGQDDITLYLTATDELKDTKTDVTVKITSVNDSPTIDIINPPAEGAIAYAFSYTITWKDSDLDDNAIITLYYDTNNTGYDGILISGAENISEDDETDSFVWDTSSLPDRATYYVYAKINDGVNSPVYARSEGQLTISYVAKGTFSRGYNYPNPATGDKTTFRYYLFEPSEVTIEIYDLNYDLIKKIDHRGEEKWNEVDLYLSDIDSGTYIYIIRADKETIINKLVVIK